MKLDTPRTPEFAAWDSFSKFAYRIRHKRRYVLGREDSAFLKTVRATIRDRDVTLREGRVLFRATVGIDTRTIEDEDGNFQGGEPAGFGATRMKPLPNQAGEGRANPAGIPVLYLGTTEQTVISEVRPWIGSQVSVAQFKLLRTLKALNLTKGHGKSAFAEVGFAHLFDKKRITAEEKEKAVWMEIDNAFSEPVTAADDAAEYAPTQMLAELFRDIGYDALIYKSRFGEKGYNIAVFDPTDADAVNCAPYQVTGIDVKFDEIGNRWYSVKPTKETGQRLGERARQIRTFPMADWPRRGVAPPNTQRLHAAAVSNSRVHLAPPAAP